MKKNFQELLNTTESEIEWSQVPPNVQKTFTEYMQDGEIEKIEKEIKGTSKEKASTRHHL